MISVRTVENVQKNVHERLSHNRIIGKVVTDVRFYCDIEQCHFVMAFLLSIRKVSIYYLLEKVNNVSLSLSIFSVSFIPVYEFFINISLDFIVKHDIIL